MLPRYCLLLFVTTVISLPWNIHSLSSVALRYNYFAIGSNMLPTTMESLRRIDVSTCNASAAVLKDYRLAFDISSGQSAAASVRYEPGSTVHGVLYALTPEQFTRVSQTEGVPFAYLWERCEVVPYKGDGDKAGELAIVQDEVESVSAFVLTTRWGRKSFDGDRRLYKDSPTGPAYLNILKQGAAHWNLDRSYQISLTKVRTTNACWDGSELLLQQAILFDNLKRI